MLKIMIVDDDPAITDFLSEVLTNAGYEVSGIASNLSEAVALGQQHRPDLAVIDLRLTHGEFGTDVAKALRKNGPIGVLYATGSPNHELLKLGSDEGCISKPYRAPSLLAALLLVRERMLNLPILSPLPEGFRLLGT